MQAREPILNTSRLVLASASPRRARLLSQIGLTFEVCPSDVVEPPHSAFSNEHGEEITQELALLKARAVAQHYSEGVIIGADTLVSLNRRLLGKPVDDADAITMLTQLSGTAHEVITGVALVNASTARTVVWAETTQVYFRRLHRTEIADYVATGEAADKAGAYGIQERGAAFVNRIEGCYFNVVGLPLASFVEHLSNFQSDVGT